MAGTARGADFALLAAGACVTGASTLLRGLRWWVLLRPAGEARAATVCWATAAGYLANSYLPARSGDLLRCLLVGRAAPVSKSAALATTLSERLLDVAFLALIGSAMLATLGGLAEWTRAAAAVMGAASGAGIVAVVAVCRLEGPVSAVLARVPLPSAPKERMLGASRQFLLGLRGFQRPGRALVFLALTGLIWLSDGLGSVVGARALGLDLSLPQALVLLTAMGLGSALPSTPGFVGIYQFVAVAVLVPFGYSQSEAIAYILVSQALYYVVVTVLGAIGLWRLSAGRGAFLPSRPPQL